MNHSIPVTPFAIGIRRHISAVCRCSMGRRPSLVWGNPKLDPVQRCHNEHNGVSNHQPHHCLLNRLFRSRSKKTSKLCVTGLCKGNSPMTGDFPAHRASDAEKCFHLMTSLCNEESYQCRSFMYVIDISSASPTTDSNAEANVYIQ